MKRDVTMSIQWRLPLLIGTAILVAVAALSTVAVVEALRATRAGAEERLSNVARQLSSMIGVQVASPIQQVGLSAKAPALVRYVVSPTTAGRTRAIRALEYRGPSPERVAAVELRDTLGRSVLRVGIDADRVSRLSFPLGPRHPGSDSGWVGALASLDSSVLLPTVAPVRDHGTTIAYLVLWRRQTGSADAQRRLTDLVLGQDASLYLANVDGSLWTNLVRPVPAPPLAISGADTLVEFERAGSGRLAVAHAVPGAPWLIMVELPSRLVDAPVFRFLRRLAVMAAILVGLAVLGAWRLSRGITRPLLELTSIAEEAAAGDIPRYTEIIRRDEIGRLARAFNDMAGRIRNTIDNLTASEQRYRTLFDSNPHPMWVVDRETLRFLAVNAAAVRDYGYSESEFLAMTPMDVRPAEDVPRFLESMQQPAVSARLTAAWRHRTRDGTTLDVEVSAHDLVFGGRPAQVVLVTDVTGRHQAEYALRESEARFRQVTEHINEAFYLVDLATFTALYVSPTWSSIWGRPASEGSDPGVWFDAIHPDDRAGVRASQQLVMNGTPAVDSFRILRPDGGTRWVRGRSFPVRDATGRVYRMVGVAEDVTELKRAREQAVQAQRIESIGRLAGGVAHDFNNLLTVIMGHIELLQFEVPADAHVVESIQEIQQAAERAGALTRQLLAFSRRQMVEPTTFLLNDLVVDLLKMLRRLIGEDVEVVTRMAPDAGAVRADHGQIEQVLINLAVNARDAMPSGGRLSIETHNVALDDAYAQAQDEVVPGDYVLLAVTDTGTGMSDEVKAQIFEPFFTTKEKGKGTGLGLATCYGIVKQSGGHISVYSEAGIGTTMKVYLRQVVDKTSQEMPTPKAALPRGTEAILLVEDEKGVRDVATRILSSQGYAVIGASNGEEALRLASRAAKIDLLLTDVVMPKMGGRELAERITSERPGLKVLFSTGYTDDSILQDRLAQHGVKVIQKPFTREALTRKVREVLDSVPSS